MTRQLCCRGMCKNLLRSDGQQQSYGKAKFPSNLNCGQKTVIETGPWSFVLGILWWPMNFTRKGAVMRLIFLFFCLNKLFVAIWGAMTPTSVTPTGCDGRLSPKPIMLRVQVLFKLITKKQFKYIVVLTKVSSLTASFRSDNLVSDENFTKMLFPFQCLDWKKPPHVIFKSRLPKAVPGLLVCHQHFETWTKYPPFCRRHIQMQFLNWKVWLPFKILQDIVRV